jgi:DNA-binding transcriptional ArsR family regulator
MGLTDQPADHTVAAGCDPGRAAEVLAALASPCRLEMVRLLADGERDVTDIASRLSISVANTSHHLGRLRHAGLVLARRDGTHIINRLAGPHMLDLCAAACETAAPEAVAAEGRWG